MDLGAWGSNVSAHQHYKNEPFQKFERECRWRLILHLLLLSRLPAKPRKLLKSVNF